MPTPSLSPSLTPSLAVEAPLWSEGHVVVGLDEVGRGSWAGPVCVGAFVLAPSASPTDKPYATVRDSKQLSRRAREDLAPLLRSAALAYALGPASPEEIDALGMTRSLRLAARRALDQLPVTPTALLLDGPHDYVGRRDLLTHTIVKGDSSSLAIACASVLAKVERDALMHHYAQDYPEYAFEQNAGYPSPTHKDALRRLGPTPLHRVSWAFMDELGGRRLPNALF